MLEPLLSEKNNVSSVVAILAALVPSPGLLLFVAQPKLFEQLDTAHLLVLLPGVGVGVLTVCALATLFVVESTHVRTNKRRKSRGETELPRERTEDWLMLAIAAAYANLLFLVLTVWAYYKPIRIGATLVTFSVIILVGSVLFAFWPARDLLERESKRRGK
jgi:hypothetical protein